MSLKVITVDGIVPRQSGSRSNKQSSDIDGGVARCSLSRWLPWAAYLVVSFFFFLVMGRVSYAQSSPPTITGISPASATAGTLITITGTNFGSSQGSSVVAFNDGQLIAAPSLWSNTQIQVTVPSTAAPGEIFVSIAGDTILPLQNPSFEAASPMTSSCGTNCVYNSGPIPSWTIVTGSAGSQQLSSAYLNLPMPDGGKTGSYINGGTISQTLTGISLQPNMTYKLSVAAAHRLDGYVTNYSISLLAGTTILNALSGSNGSIPAGSFADEFLTYTTGSSVPSGSLTVQLSTTGSQVDFSAVRLTVGASTVETTASWYFIVIPPPLPSGWLDQDVGAVSVAGSAGHFTNGVFTISGAGQQIYGSSDSFNFAYQTLSGDGTILARVLSVQGAGGSATAGVMIRETLNAGSTNAKTSDWPENNGIYLDLRASTNGSTSEPGSVNVTLPYWVKVIRSGSTFSSFASPDGVNWTQLGSSQTITMAQNAYIGLAVNSGSSSSLATATFDNVAISTPTNPAPVITNISATTGPIGSGITISGSSFGPTQGSSVVLLNGTPLTIVSWSSSSIIAAIPTGATSGPLLVSVGPSMNESNPVEFNVTTLPLPPTWLDQDLGPTGGVGSGIYSNGVFTISGAGKGMSGLTADQVHFVYQPLSGDGTIIARVSSLAGGTGSPAAGLMIRETLSANATSVSVGYNASYQITYQRTSTGASSSSQDYTLSGVSFPLWLMLVRSGNSFSENVSTDGMNWRSLGSSQTVSMAQNVYIGLVVDSGNNTSVSTATFDSVSTSSGAAPAPVITGISATTGSIGSQVTITGSGFGSSQSGSYVNLNGNSTIINSWSATSIVTTIPVGATSGLLVVTVTPNMDDSNPEYFEVTTQPLPISWLDQDVGIDGLRGSSSYANGVFTVSGAGQGMNGAGSADQLHFVYYPLSGDGTIVARIVSSQGTSGSQSAGVLIQETLSPVATGVLVSSWHGYTLLWQRLSTGAGVGSTYDLSNGLPYWVKLVRSGNLFTGFASADGVNWVQLQASQTISMAQNVYIGLAVSSGDNTSLATATFDNVSITTTASPAPAITSVSATSGTIGTGVTISGSGFGSTQGNSQVLLSDAPVTINSWGATSISITIPTGAISGYLAVLVAPTMNASNPVTFAVTNNPIPSPWLDQDVGSVGVAGGSGYSSGTFTVNGAGLGMAGTADQFHFVYQSLSGDGMIAGRVVNLNSPFGQAGVAIRETLSAGATGMVAGDASYIFISQRTSTGASGGPQINVIGGVVPYWIRLVRSGNTVTGYGSSDGLNWIQLGASQNLTMASNVEVGLFVDSGNNTSLATASFDNVQVVSGDVPVVSSISPNFGGYGTSVTIVGNNFGSSQGSSTVTFSGVAATSISSWTNTQIVALLPSGATTGPVAVNVSSVSSTPTYTFTVINPVISSLTPPAAGSGGTITLNGAGFGAGLGGNSVQFNGVSAAGISSWSDTSVTVFVPSNATSGPVTLTQQGVTSNGVQFTLLEPLTLTAISPTSGPVGGTVTITGTGFGATQSNSTVDFFGTPVTSIVSWTDTQIVALVPAGAATGPVHVNIAGNQFYGPFFTITETVNLTDSLSNSTSYISAMIGGAWVALSSQGSGCSSCTLRGTIGYTYDSQGHVLSKADELGRVSTYTYDANGNVLTASVPVGSGNYATTTNTFNSFGEVLTTTDPLGNVTTNTYDALGNLLTVTTPAPNGATPGSVTTFTYDTKGELLTIKDPLNNATALTYTTAGLIATITDAQSNVTTYGYDAHGNRTSVTDALNHQTTFTYDSMDRLTKIAYPDTTTTQFGYDYRGRRTSVTDQNGKTTTYAYDDADRLLTVTDAATNVTAYGYDTEDNLTSIKDANSNTTSFTYDAFGRVTKTIFPSNLTESYSYDAVGNLASKTDRKGQYIAYNYDQLNRLTLKTYPDTTTVNYTYDNDSRLTQVTDPTGAYSFTFDNMGRLTNTSTQYAFLTGRSFTTSYGYDAASNRTGFTDPENGSTSYLYDTLNRLKTLTPPTAYGTGSFGFAYDALSRRTGLTRPNSVNTAYSYDNLSHLLSVTHANAGTTLDGASYTVDNAGNRQSRTSLPGTTATNYTYDAIYQLLMAAQGSTTQESYSYDPVGNRLTSLGVSSYTTNSSNELTAKTGESYTYDNNGNTLTSVTGSNTTTYAWDFENRLTSVTLPGSGGTVSFKYDPFGRRIYKSSTSATSVFAYDGDNLIEETNSSGSAVARYSQTNNIDEPLAMLRSGATSYFNADGLGSITSLTNSSGAAVQTYTYDSFGNTTASTGSLTNPFRYAGREFDTETGLYFYRARYYDSQSGRFLSEDPLSINGDDLNFYRYVGNSPASFYDPMGWQRVNSPRTGPPNSTAWFPNPQTGDVTVRVYGPNGEAVTDYDYGHDHTGAGDPHAYDWGKDKNGKPTRGKPRPIKPGEKVPPPVCPKKEAPPQPFPPSPYCTPQSPYDCLPDFRPRPNPIFPWLPPLPPLPIFEFPPILVPSPA